MPLQLCINLYKYQNRYFVVSDKAPGTQLLPWDWWVDKERKCKYINITDPKLLLKQEFPVKLFRR